MSVKVEGNFVINSRSMVPVEDHMELIEQLKKLRQENAGLREMLQKINLISKDPQS